MRWSTWLWARLLLAIDKLLGTRLVERKLARQQVKMERLAKHLQTVNRDLDVLAGELAFYRLILCLVELKARSEREDLEDWLRFAPHNEGDESLLDDAIECLVKPRLATVDTEPDGADRYLYRLHPDWTAIIAHLDETVVALELTAWLEEQM